MPQSLSKDSTIALQAAFEGAVSSFTVVAHVDEEETVENTEEVVENTEVKE